MPVSSKKARYRGEKHSIRSGKMRFRSRNGIEKRNSARSRDSFGDARNFFMVNLDDIQSPFAIEFIEHPFRSRKNRLFRNFSSLNFRNISLRLLYMNMKVYREEEDKNIK